MSLTLTGAGPPGGWSPLALPSLQASLVPAVSRSRGLLFQDAGKTTPATADGDPVRVATCPFTAQDYTAPSDAQRPVLHTDGSNHWWLTFDGVDDQFGFTGAIPGTAISTFNAVNFSDLSTNRTLLGGTAGSGAPFNFCQGVTTKAMNLYVDNVTALPESNTSLSTATWYLVGVTFSSPTIAYRLNQANDGGGSTAGNFTAAGNQYGDLRSGGRMAGSVACHVWGTAQWNAAQIALLEAYIRNLYP